MALLFGDLPEATRETTELAERLRFDLTQDLGYRYPAADDTVADAELAQICALELERRYRGLSHRGEARTRLDEELALIRFHGLSGFFLLHREILEIAREIAIEVRGPHSARMALPPGRGRGSSVGSIVCYLTGLSHVDPVAARLSLGRFLNRELAAVPDIDLDFPRDIREKLILAVHDRFGRERSALIAAFSTYRSRSAIRELGKALGLPPPDIDRLARGSDGYRAERVGEELAQTDGVRERSHDRRFKALAHLCGEIAGLPRHLSQHPGGMIVSTGPLAELVPLVPAAMEGRQLCQWDKDSCADAGFLKIDLLGLGMLSAVERCIDLIARARGETIDLSRAPLDDPGTYAEIQAADTVGVFQIESRAQMQMLLRTRPENLEDLTVEVALVRPGPIQGGAVHPYLQRREAVQGRPGLPRAPRPSAAGRGARRHAGRDRLPGSGARRGRRARGLLAGPGREPAPRDEPAALARGDGGALERVPGGRARPRRRRADGAARVREDRGVLGVRLPQGARGRVRPARLPERLAPPSLPRRVPVRPAQRAADGLLPAGLARARRAAPRGRDTRHRRQRLRRRLQHRARRRGADRPRLRARPRRAGGTRPRGGARAGRPVHRRGRSRAPGRSLAARVRADHRRRRLRHLRAATRATLASRADRPAGVDARRAATGTRPRARRHARAAAPGAWDELVADYETTGLSVRDHPLAQLRAGLTARGFVTTAALEHIESGTPVSIAGLTVARQRPASAKGVVFLLLEDEHGLVNLVLFSDVYEKHRLLARTEPLLEAHGKLERRERNINVIVEHLVPLGTPSRRVLPTALQPVGSSQTFEELPVAVGDDVTRLRATAPGAHHFGSGRGRR